MEEKRHVRDYGEMKEGQSFSGEIVSANWEEGTYGEQLHLSIKPLDHQVKGETGMYHEWFRESERRMSKYGAFLKALKELGIKFNTEDDLIGKKFMFERKTIEFDGGMVAEDVLIPVSMADGTKPQVAGQKPTQLVIDPTKFQELADKLKTDGMTQGQIAKWAQRKGIMKTELDAYMGLLDKEGKLQKDADGLIMVASK